MERIALAPDFTISRIIKGGWQLSQGHSTSLKSDPVQDMFDFADAGITSFDCADIYTGVEDAIGKFLQERKKRFGHNNDIQVLTKFVPDYDALATLDRHYVQRIIDRSLQRLGLAQLDVVQFSWWSYQFDRYVEVAGWLRELQQAGKIRLLAGTNFNTEATLKILAAGVPLVSMQTQYSVLDNRPEHALASCCLEHRMKLLCYGTVAGGFLDERWLGVPEPQPPFENRSLVKYKLMIDDFGGWHLFQELLQTLAAIARQHGVSIANVASCFTLEQPAVGALIIGARSAAHLHDNLRIFRFQLSDSEHKEIQSVLSKRTGPPGEPFDLERIKEGKHGAIMRYNLNQLS